MKKNHALAMDLLGAALLEVGPDINMGRPERVVNTPGDLPIGKRRRPKKPKCFKLNKKQKNPTRWAKYPK